MNDRRRHPRFKNLSRLPLRLRLVMGFVVAMTILLCAAGTFVYWRVKTDLDIALDRDLTQELAATLPLVGPTALCIPSRNQATVPGRRSIRRFLPRERCYSSPLVRVSGHC
jgi:hypothetical protein